VVYRYMSKIDQFYLKIMDLSTLQDKKELCLEGIKITLRLFERIKQEVSLLDQQLQQIILQGTMLTDLTVLKKTFELIECLAQTIPTLSDQGT